MALSLRLQHGFTASSYAVRRRRRAQFRLADAGSAAVEFAIIGPILLLMIMGIYVYGGYFLTAHTVQQLANDAARASIAGLDDTERSTLARQSLEAGMTDQPSMRGELANVRVTRSGQMLAVNVTYDARDDLYWAFSSIVPAPSPIISRTASIRLGGF